MTYKVIRTFKDGQSEELHVYRNGDVFPFGYEVSESRILELLGSDNAIGMPLIVEVIDKDNVTDLLWKSKFNPSLRNRSQNENVQRK